MAEFSVGQVIQLGDGRLATIRYIGDAHFQHGEWIGVELDDESGKNDGSVQGQRYFDCGPGRGMFVRPAAVAYVEPAVTASAPPPVKPIKSATVLAKKPTRPSSVASTGTGRRLSSVPDVGAAKRVSVNSVSPSPVTRSRPSSMLRVNIPHFLVTLFPSNDYSRLPNLQQNNFLERHHLHRPHELAHLQIQEHRLLLCQNQCDQVQGELELQWVRHRGPLGKDSL